MTMKRQIAKSAYLFFLLSIISGCHSVPPDNVDFAQINNIKELEGVYNNYGEGKPNTRFVYLSQLIWQKEEGLNHFLIQSVDIKMVNDKTLLIRGLAENGSIIKEEAFIEGKDFELAAGLISLPGNCGFPYPIVGISYENSELGIDMKNDGKCKTRTTSAGLLALAIPLILIETEEFRFLRMKK